MQTVGDLSTLRRIFHKHTAILRIWGVLVLLSLVFIVLAIVAGLFVIVKVKGV